jgi:hypothetical protein
VTPSEQAREAMIAQARDSHGTVVTDTGLPLCWRCAELIPEFGLAENTNNDPCVNGCVL